MAHAKTQADSEKQKGPVKKRKTNQDAQNSTLSEEKVVDSDAEQDSSAEARKPVQKHRSSTESESDEVSSESETNGKVVKGARSKTSKTSTKSKKPTKDANESKRKGSPGDSDASSDSDRDESERVSKKVRLDEKISDTIKSNGDVTDDANEKSQSASVDKGKRPVPSEASQRGMNAKSILQSINVATYLPPQGYRRLASNVESVLDNSQMKGLELWHITAPANIPLDSLSSLVEKAIEAPDATLSHEDYDYALVDDSNPSSTVFINNNNGFEAASQKVRRSLNLQVKLKLPVISARAVSKDAGNITAANIATPSVLSIRPQPKGLKMRFKLSAFGTGETGTIGGNSSDDDDDMNARDKVPTLQFPKALGPHPDGDNPADLAAKKKKKKKDKSKDHDTERAPNGLGEHFQPAPSHGPVRDEKNPIDPAAIIEETDIKAKPPEQKDDDDDDDADEAARKKERKRAKKLAMQQAQAAG